MKMARVTLCSVEDSGKQRCSAPPHTLAGLSANLNQVAKISTAKSNYVCTLWPREDNAELLQVDPMVWRSTHPDLETEFASMVIEQSNVQLLQTSVVDKVIVSIVASELECVQNLRCTSDIGTVIKDVLHGYYVAPTYTCCCKRNSIAKVYGISYIVIHKTVPSSEACLVHEDTVVEVEQIISKERHTYLQSPRYKRVAGADVQCASLREILETLYNYSHSSPVPFDYLCRTVLLHGPSGCGKTCLVKKVARDCDALVITVNGSEIVGSLPGESEENLREVFGKAELASKEGPVVLFLDDLDTFCAKRKSTSTQDNRLFSQLISLLDRFCCTNVGIIGATNKPGVIDVSLRRPGKFEKEIIFGMPTLGERNAILQSLMEDLKFELKVDLHNMAESTPGFVAADLKSLCEHACYLALMDNTDSTNRFTEVASKHFDAALHSHVPSTQRGSDILVDYKPVSWDDIGGLEEVKQKIQQAVEWPMKHQDSFLRLGLATPKGILLYGPPGCAKTTLVRAAATASHVTFLSISGAQLMSPYVGDSERKVSEAFRLARAGAPTILFIDEIDSVIGSRSKGKQSSAHDRLLSTLLNEMDGVGLRSAETFSGDTRKLAEGQSCSDTGKAAGQLVEVDNRDVLVVAATNRPDLLDEALIRPGRIDRIIYVPPPDKAARLQILKVHTKRTPLVDVDLEEIAEATVNFTGADLENLCREAALLALTEDGLDMEYVCGRHFTKCLKHLPPSLTAEQIAKYQDLHHRC